MALCVINFNHRIAVTLYALETLFHICNLNSLHKVMINNNNNNNKDCQQQLCSSSNLHLVLDLCPKHRESVSQWHSAVRASDLRSCNIVVISIVIMLVICLFYWFFLFLLGCSCKMHNWILSVLFWDWLSGLRFHKFLPSQERNKCN